MSGPTLEKYRVRVKAYRGTGNSAAHIQVKASGADILWPGATIASNAASESWTEQTVTIPTGATTLQVGVNWNTVTAGEIMYVNEVEITKLSTTAPEYQYHLKDHLGNVRTTFTTVVTTDQQTATLEAANLNTESGQFLRIATAKRVNATIFDKTNGAATGYSERLNGSANEKYGVAKSISVMPGDVINAQVYGKYVDSNTSNWTGALTTLMSQIAANTAGVVVDGASYTSSTSTFPFTGLLSTTGSTGGPKAYINWLIFDRNYTLLNGGYTRMSATPKEQGQDIAHELMASPTINITQPGYVYIYLSNEETTPVEVYFDDFRVTHTKSPVVQVDDYYPFGLSISGLSFQRENSTAQDFKYNGKELQDELGLGWLDYGARMYMAEIGRWAVIDPLGDKHFELSTYNFVNNNPIKFIDPDGRDYGLAIDHTNKTITVSATFYVQKGDSKSAASANQAVGTWNNQNGKFTYRVGKGESAVEYAVNFALKVDEVDDPRSEYNNDRRSTAKEKKTGDGSSNVFEVLPDDDSSFGPDDHGVTEGRNLIKVKESDADGTTGAHEIGHAFGLNHSSSGLMTKGENDDNHSKSPGIFDIQRIIQSASKGNDISKVTTSGQEPDGFKKGKGKGVN